MKLRLFYLLLGFKLGQNRFQFFFHFPQTNPNRSMLSLIIFLSTFIATSGINPKLLDLSADDLVERLAGMGRESSLPNPVAFKEPSYNHEIVQLNADPMVQNLVDLGRPTTSQSLHRMIRGGNYKLQILENFSMPSRKIYGDPKFIAAHLKARPFPGFEGSRRIVFPENIGVQLEDLKFGRGEIKSTWSKSSVDLFEYPNPSDLQTNSAKKIRAMVKFKVQSDAKGDVIILKVEEVKVMPIKNELRRG